MLISCEYIGDGNSSYKLIDTDFEEIVKLDSDDVSPIGRTCGQEAAVIKAYENHGLPVASNLMKLLLLEQKRLRADTLTVLIGWNMDNTLKFHKYVDAIKQYMLLL